MSFLFGWARFSVITTGSIALLAFVFGDYMYQAVPLGALGVTWGSALYAVAAIAVLSWVNLRGIRAGAFTQTWLTVLEVGGLLLIFGAALWLVAGGAPAAPAAPAAAAPSAPGMASFGMAKSDALAADLLGVAFGAAGAKVISVMVAVAALTSINATMIVGARTNYALGRDWPALHKLAFWDGATGSPVNAMRVQSLAALLLVLLGAWTGSGFKSMVEFTAPVFWLFFLLSGLALFVLRVREPDVERPFRVPLFPLLPLLFCATCSYMLWSSLSYVYSQSLGGLNAAWIGVGVLAVGGVLLLLVGLVPARPAVVRSETLMRRRL